MPQSVKRGVDVEQAILDTRSLPGELLTLEGDGRTLRIMFIIEVATSGGSRYAGQIGVQRG